MKMSKTNTATPAQQHTKKDAADYFAGLLQQAEEIITSAAIHDAKKNLKHLAMYSCGKFITNSLADLGFKDLSTKPKSLKADRLLLAVFYYYSPNGDLSLSSHQNLQVITTATQLKLLKISKLIAKELQNFDIGISYYELTAKQSKTFGVWAYSLEDIAA